MTLRVQSQTVSNSNPLVIRTTLSILDTKYLKLRWDQSLLQSSSEILSLTMTLTALDLRSRLTTRHETLWRSMTSMVQSLEVSLALELPDSTTSTIETSLTLISRLSVIVTLSTPRTRWEMKMTKWSTLGKLMAMRQQQSQREKQDRSPWAWRRMILWELRAVPRVWECLLTESESISERRTRAMTLKEQLPAHCRRLPRRNVSPILWSRTMLHQEMWSTRELTDIWWIDLVKLILPRRKEWLENLRPSLIWNLRRHSKAR